MSWRHTPLQVLAAAGTFREVTRWWVCRFCGGWILAVVATPNPDGAEHFGYDQHALSQLQKDTLPKAAVVTAN